MYYNRRIQEMFQKSLCLSKIFILSVLTTKAFLSLPLKAVNSSLAVSLEVCFPEVVTLILEASLFPLPFPHHQ